MPSTLTTRRHERPDDVYPTEITTRIPVRYCRHQPAVIGERPEVKPGDTIEEEFDVLIGRVTGAWLIYESSHRVAEIRSVRERSNILKKAIAGYRHE
jgi:hypothetical protein